MYIPPPHRTIPYRSFVRSRIDTVIQNNRIPGPGRALEARVAPPVSPAPTPKLRHTAHGTRSTLHSTRHTPTHTAATTLMRHATTQTTHTRHTTHVPQRNHAQPSLPTQPLAVSGLAQVRRIRNLAAGARFKRQRFMASIRASLAQATDLIWSRRRRFVASGGAGLQQPPTHT